MKIIKILLPAILLILPGCWWWLYDNDYEFEFETIITDYPANMEGINSTRDDYNSALPYRFEGRGLYFSSNSTTYGDNFDIVYRAIEITFHPKKDNILNVSYPAANLWPSYEMKVCAFIKTDFNEYGPYTHSDKRGWDYFFYANDEKGDLDIKFVYNSTTDNLYNENEKFEGPVAAGALNSGSDDAYPTINIDGSRIYFCSNRENNQFDIYYATMIQSVLHTYLSTPDTLVVLKETILSGDKNDKCPFIIKNLLVFTSDREGGYGGYDLYYSLYVDSKWSAPVNFGEKINTEYNEYRPVTIPLMSLSDEVMIFSSDRPGGKGGYDLYCVNIGDMIEDPWYMLN